jgi:SNF2 family DNA or RNA helicase
LIKLIESGVLLVFDECQKIKNSKTMAFKACQEMTRTLMRVKGTSRFAMLSATPFDEKKYTLSFYRLMGFLTEPLLYHKNPITRQVNYLGIQEIVNLATTFDPTITNDLFEEYIPKLNYAKISRENAEDFMFEVFVKVIKNTIGSTMKEPIMDTKLHVYNAFYNIPIEDRANIRRNIDAFRGLATPIIEGEEKWTLSRVEQMGAAMRAIELDKAYLIATLAGKNLNDDKLCKVVLSMNNRKTINLLAEILSDFEPLVLSGKAPKKGEVTNEEKIIEFQTTDKKRLLIMTTQLGGVGLNLHDTQGNRKRYMYISPNYSMINIFQATGRVHRVGSMSDAYVYIVYGVNKGTTEFEILNALAKKGGTVKATIPDDVNGGESKIKYPSDYPELREDDDEEVEMKVKSKDKGKKKK